MAQHPGRMASTYLFLYNFAMAVGWTAVLAKLVRSYLFNTSPSLIYSAFSPLLRFFQTGALLEVVHSLIGIVRASAATTAFQVASRLFILWGVTELVTSAQETCGLLVMVAAWALTEIPRYTYFAVSGVRRPPHWLIWLRYSTFYILYPMGAGGEAFTLLTALPEIKETRVGTISMPNAWNFAFDYYFCCVVILCVYPFGLPYMFMHMMRQRRKYLDRNERKRKSS